jgi:6-phosphogluconolactonase
MGGETGEDAILGFRFNAVTGRLGESPFLTEAPVAGSGPRRLALGRGARHLYAITEHHGTVLTYRRDPETGVLVKIQTVSMLPDQLMAQSLSPVRRKPPGAADIRVSPDGRHLYASDRVTNTIAAFTVHEVTGMLTPIHSIAGEPTPRSIAIDESGEWLLCIGVSSGTVGSYAIDRGTGRLAKCSSTKLADTIDWVVPMGLP